MTSKEKLEFIKKIPQFPQKSEGWFNQRKGKLTSSDSATALGLNPYQSIADLFFKKCGIGGEFTGSDATNHGQKFESEAIDKYSELMNKTNHEFGLIEYTSIDPIRTKRYEFNASFLAGSPDGIATDNDDEEDLVMLEVKCPFRRKIIPGKCPEYYYPQIQLNLLILDLKLADYIEYLPANTFPIYSKEPILNIVRVHRNEKWLAQAIPQLLHFWSLVNEWKHRITEHPLYDRALIKYGIIPEVEDEPAPGPGPDARTSEEP
jgi:putative phage-type endonuclease